MCNYSLYKFMFYNFMNSEPIEILDILKVKYNIIFDHNKYLRKITTIEDLF